MTYKQELESAMSSIGIEGAGSYDFKTCTYYGHPVLDKDVAIHKTMVSDLKYLVETVKSGWLKINNKNVFFCISSTGKSFKVWEENSEYLPSFAIRKLKE